MNVVSSLLAPLRRRGGPGGAPTLLSLAVLGALFFAPLPALAQAPEAVAIVTPAGPSASSISVATSEGFAAFRATDLGLLGWEVEESGSSAVLRWPDGDVVVTARAGNPFLSWSGEGVHLAQAPYAASGGLYLPLQVLVDVFPWKLPLRFRFQTGSWTLEVLDPSGPARSPAVGEGVGGAEASEPGPDSLESQVPPPPAPRQDSVRVVVIDPGHGGRDPGARGTGGTQEKTVALAIGVALARILRAEPNLEVYLTRDNDELIPLWQRGELATEWKGERPGIFVSIHANAMPSPGATRGFETYFLSEARTDHERRVQALENASQEFEEGYVAAPSNDPDLSFMLTDLRNLDHQHWSALLGELVQAQLAQVHPGPNRGVKQGLLAVITNALMPSVLVEVGFLSNREEERLLGQRSFQEDVARALARAVREFFRRYPPGSGQDILGNGQEGLTP